MLVLIFGNNKTVGKSITFSVVGRSNLAVLARYTDQYFNNIYILLPSAVELSTTHWAFNVDLNSTGVGRRVVVGSEFAATLLDARAREVRGQRLARSPTAPHLAASPPRCKSQHLRTASLVTTA